MANVLVGPIGDHPVVFTATHDALRAAGIMLDAIEVICPQAELIQHAVYWVDEETPCPVESREVAFDDANSETAAIQYLHTLAQVLDVRESNGDNVYILLAGGRKNMSALTAVLAQFYANVQMLCHVLDVYEDDPQRRNLFSLQELYRMPTSERRQRFHPPPDAVHFFEVPFPRIDYAPAVRKFLQNPFVGDPPPIEIEPEFETFFGNVFAGEDVEPLLEVWLTETARQRFEELWNHDRNRAEAFRACFCLMQHPTRLQMPELGMHGCFAAAGRQFHFFKRRRTVERPFYYTSPSPIHLYPRKPVDKVVVCGLTIEREGEYDLSADDHLATRDFEPTTKFDQLPRTGNRTDGVLLVPLGETPMIASQAWELLKSESAIASVHLLYPGANPSIIQKAEDLGRDFEREGASCELHPISDLADVDSTSACRRYLDAVVEILRKLRQAVDTDDIHLLLSGGRKSMSALNLFAAQRVGLSRVWHTLVKDHRLEQQIDAELQNASSPRHRRDIMFLRRHGRHNFVLFSVPVFPVQKSTT